MRTFYRARIEDDLAPAAALRKAQLAVAADPRWSSPWHWAGFVFTGDWSADDPPAYARRADDGTVEIADKGGVGTVGKPDIDFPIPPCHPPAAVPGGDL